MDDEEKHSLIDLVLRSLPLSMDSDERFRIEGELRPLPLDRLKRLVSEGTNGSQQDRARIEAELRSLDSDTLEHELLGSTDQVRRDFPEAFPTPIRVEFFGLSLPSLFYGPYRSLEISDSKLNAMLWDVSSEDDDGSSTVVVAYHDDGSWHVHDGLDGTDVVYPAIRFLTFEQNPKPRKQEGKE